MSRQPWRVVALRSLPTLLACAVISSLLAAPATADVYNLKVVTDANPDYSDLDSLAHSATSQWKTDAEKMWALFYWNHIARRQTEPMQLHGKAETDPIRQFNDYGFTMCSTISGINCMIWQHMGYPVKYYDIAVHTVPEVFYDNAWHHYDNSLSVIYTLCDGKTIAGIEDVGKTLSCPASGGKAEPGHIALYHALNGTGPDGFLEGADTMRDLRHLGEETFKPEYLKYRYYTNDGERGHRYILNLRDGEVYTRHYSRLDKPAESGGDKFVSDPAYFTSNGKTKDGKPRDPESANPRYRIRGNGVRTYAPTKAPADGIYKIEGANVITSMKITADSASAIAISTNNGMSWNDVLPSASGKVDLKLIDEVNGAYEVLVKAPSASNIRFETITQINSKTQPKLNIGKNTVYVGAGEQTGHPPLGERHAVVLAEVAAERGGAHHVREPLGAAEAVHRERQVLRNAQHDRVVAARRSLVELAHAGGAHRRVDAREDVQHDLLAGELLGGHVGQITARERERGSVGADRGKVAGRLDGIAAELGFCHAPRCSTWSRHRRDRTRRRQRIAPRRKLRRLTSTTTTTDSATSHHW